MRARTVRSRRGRCSYRDARISTLPGSKKAPHAGARPQEKLAPSRAGFRLIQVDAHRTSTAGGPHRHEKPLKPVSYWPSTRTLPEPTGLALLGLGGLTLL